MEVNLGNSSGNIHNRGYFSIKDNLLYFSNDHDGQGLYIRDLTTNKLRHLTNFPVDNINVGSEWIYFRGTDWRIFKIKSDNSEFESLTRYSVRSILLIGNYLYHTSDNDLIRIDIKTDKKEYLNKNQRIHHLTEYMGNLLYSVEGDMMIYHMNLETLEVSKFLDIGHNFILNGDRIYYTLDDNILSNRLDGTDCKVLYQGYEGSKPILVNSSLKNLFFSVCDREYDENGQSKYIKWERVIFKIPFNNGSASIFINKLNAHSLNIINSTIYYIHGYAFHEINENSVNHSLSKPFFYRKPKTAEKVTEAIVNKVITNPNDYIEEMVYRTKQYYMLDSRHKPENFFIGISHHPSITLYEEHKIKRHDYANSLWAFEQAVDANQAQIAKKYLLERGMNNSGFDQFEGLFVYCFFKSEKKTKDK